MDETDREIMSLFGEAAEIASPEERAAFLDKACAGSAERRNRINALLEAYKTVGNFLEGKRSSLHFLRGKVSELTGTIDDPRSEEIGSFIGPYKVLEQIGEGGFGVVFMAEQAEPVRRKVALKILKPGMDSKHIIARFDAERQALALMDHPNIAKILEAGQTVGGRPYFVMDLVKGLPITEYCNECQLTTRARLELFVTVCKAVQHAHQKGIIHRDIKPSNVLVTLHDGAPLVKVIDFGIAKALGQQLTDKTLFTGFAQLIGTPLYMAPEQAALSNIDVDTRSDVYSLGVLLYELLTGMTPFDKQRFKDADYEEIRRIIREEDPPKPSTRISTLGKAASTISMQRKCEPQRLTQLFRGELDWIVMKALEKDRNRRFESASAFAADVQRYLDDEPVLACPPSAIYRLRKFARRNRPALIMASLLVFSLLSTLLVLAISNVLVIQERNEKTNLLGEKEKALKNESIARNDSDAAKKELEVNLYLRTIALAERHLSAGSPGLAERLLDSDLCRPTMRGWEWHYLKGLGRGSTVVAKTNSILFNLTQSRDGQWLAAGGNDGTITLVNAQTGKVQTFPAHRGRVSGLDFTRDGLGLWSGGEDEIVRLWNIRGDGQLPAPGKEVNNGSDINSLAIKPDQGSLAVGGAASVNIFDTGTGRKLVELLDAGKEVGPPLAFSEDGRLLITGFGDLDLAVWDTSRWQREFVLNGHKVGELETMAISRDGRLLASASRRMWDDSDACEVILWDLEQRRIIHRLKGLGGGATSLAFSPDGLRLASGGSEDPTIRIWNVETGQETLILRGHDETIFGLAFSPDGHRLYSASADHTIRVWDATPAAERPRLELRVLAGHEGRVNNLAFTNDGRNLISGGMDRTARLWDVTSGKELRTLFQGSSPVYAVALSPDGDSLATGSYAAYSTTEQPELRIWDAKIWKERWCQAFPSWDGGGITSLAYSHDSERLVLTTTFHPTVVDAKTGFPLLNLRSTRRLVRALAYSSQGQIAWGGLDGEVMIWQESPNHYLTPVLAALLPAPLLSKATSTLLAFQAMPTEILPAHGSRSVNVAFTSEGGRLASCGIDGSIKVWDRKGEQWVERVFLRGHLGPVHALAFLPDGRFLISGGQDATIRIWSIETGSQVLELRGHSDCVYCLALSPDGRYLASGDSQGQIRIWDANRFLQQMANEKGFQTVPATERKASPSKSKAGR